MINKQLETNVNNERILSRLAENLNIDFVSDGSNIKKIADAYSSETLGFANGVDSAISNGFVTTMSPEFLELFGRQYNIYRKNYNNISVYAYQEAVELKVDKEEAMVTTIDSPVTVFKKGQLIHSDSNLIIESLSDIVISDINTPQTISIRISLSLGINQYSIQEGSSFKVMPSDPSVSNYLPSFSLVFKRPVGLAVIQEFEQDFKLRIFEATYVANNGANSLIASVTKEVPFLYYIETENYKEGRAIKVIYPYTQELIDNGYDDVVENYLLPIIESNLQNKTLYGQLISVVSPQPLLASIAVVFSDNNYVTNTYLDNITLQFNRFFSTYKKLNKEIMSDFIKAELGVYSQNIKSIDFTFTSPHVSEETFNLTNEYENVELPNGRFLHITSIRSLKASEQTVRENT